jgi:thiol-disulfide isomerase/thioredoxin
MKIIILIFVFFILISCNKTDKIKVKGVLSNCHNQTLYFEKVDVFKIKKIDSLIIKNNCRFSFSTAAKLPDFYQLRISDSKIISLLMEPGEKALISADFNNPVNTLIIKGSKGSILLNELLKKLEITKLKLDSISNIYNNSINESVKENLVEAYKEIIEEHRKYSTAFILDNFSSLACITALYQEISPQTNLFNRARDIQFFKLVTDSLSKKYPRSNHVTVLRANTNKLLNDYNRRKILSLAGSKNYVLPEIALPDIKGDTIKLTSLKGRYVLLSFWASWNEESVNANLELKKVYEKYHNKGFEIYQVSFDKSVNQWNRAIKFDELPWLNVNDSTFPQSVTARNYNVNNLPLNYLIDKNMETILGKNLSSDELNNKLSELFN